MIGLDKILISLVAAAFVTSCSSSGSNDVQPAEIVRLDHAVDDRIMADSLTGPLGVYMQMMGLDGSNVSASIDVYKSTEAFRVFNAAVQSGLPDLGEAELKLGEFDEKLGDYPRVAARKYYGIISPYRQPIVLTDDATYIALNHYLGAGHDVYSGMPEYLRRLKNAERIPVDVAEARLSRDYPYEENSSSTALSRMVYEGALANAVIGLIPGVTIASYNSWDDDEADFVDENESRIWNVIVANDMLYSTDPAVGERLSAAAPSSSVISADVPARVGRYFGYEIVKAYLKAHPEATPESLLLPDFYNDSSVLIESGYVPQD